MGLWVGGQLWASSGQGSSGLERWRGPKLPDSSRLPASRDHLGRWQRITKWSPAGAEGATDAATWPQQATINMISTCLQTEKGTVTAPRWCVNYLCIRKDGLFLLFCAKLRIRQRLDFLLWQRRKLCEDVSVRICVAAKTIMQPW